MSKRTWLIILLVCWMPLQAVAAALVPCHAVSMLAGTSTDSDHAHSAIAPVEGAEGGDCHGETASGTVPEEATDDYQDAGVCLHCATDCHSIQTLSLSDANHDYTYLSSRFSLTYSPAVLAQWPENPQRPPIG